MAKYVLDIPDKIIAHIRSDYGHGIKWINEEDRKILVELIYNAKPIVEITPIVWGKWIECDETIQCSNCGTTYIKHDNSIQYKRYCERCGAKMQGDAE